MDVYYCNPKNCNKKKSCNHYLVKKQLRPEKKFAEIFAEIERNYIEEDLSDICLPDYRLFIFGDYFNSFPSKEYYKNLLNFFDNICEGEQCQSCETYGPQSSRYPSSKIECKRGKEYTCNHEKHPNNRAVLEVIKLLEAEREAFKNAGLDTGIVEFTCPICGGKAVANRHYSYGRIKGTGSHCSQCGISHT